MKKPSKTGVEKSRAEVIGELLSRFPEHGSRTLAKRLVQEHPLWFHTFNAALCAVRGRRGALGQLNRKKAYNTHHRVLPPLPESVAPTWEPFEISAKRVLVLSDIHLPHHCVQALRAALKYGDAYHPDTILINGDLCDMYAASRFDKCPTVPKLAAELHACGEFFDHLRQRFSKAKIYYKLGNHDERWFKYIYQAAPLLADIPEIVNGWEGPAGVTRNSVTVIRDQRPVMLGKLMVLHGHERGGGSSAVNPARGAFLKLLSCVLEGHLHKQSEHTETTADGRVIACWSTGCLCGMHPEYARINKWSQGFATVDVSRDGSYKVRLHRIISGRIF